MKKINSFIQVIYGYLNENFHREFKDILDSTTAAFRRLCVNRNETCIEINVNDVNQNDEAQQLNEDLNKQTVAMWNS